MQLLQSLNSYQTDGMGARTTKVHHHRQTEQQTQRLFERHGSFATLMFTELACTRAFFCDLLAGSVEEGSC